MKLLTLNTHSIIEENYVSKMKIFAGMIIDTQPDIIALQEVNQTLGKPLAKELAKTGYVPCKGGLTTVLADNHAFSVAKLLEEKNISYYWTWIPLKIGYMKYEEGLALFSKYPIEETKQFFISGCKDMNNWKTRKMLGIKVNGNWYYSVHMGWWDDKEEPFVKQWCRVTEKLGNPKEIKEHCFVMGDFNCPAQIKGEGYDFVSMSGWFDTWKLAKEKDAGITVGHVIDGWKERVENAAKGMRIDYIWCNKPINVISSKVVFNDVNYQIVSDHYGVETEIEI